MSNQKTVISNFFWRFAERMGAQGVSFVVSIILARLLLPEDYGLIALVTVFMSILQVFVDSGLGTALIQKKDADDLDFSTVFYFNFIVCVILYILLFFSAPWIAGFYEKEQLIEIIRVLGLILIISGFKNIQQSYVSRHLIFKRFFWATLGGTLIAAVAGIIMAMNGFGVWALVIQNLVNAAIDTLILWITVKWRPIKAFSFERLKKLYSFGWKLLFSRLLETLYQDLRQLIIGKLYSSADLAFYNRGKQLPHLAVTNINTSIDSVLLPTMAKVQDDNDGLKRMTRKSISVSTYLMMPIMIGLVACANPLVELLLTEKWLPSIPYLQIFCISYALLPINTANLNAIKAIGRSDLFLKLEIIKKIIGIILLLGTMKFGVLVMAYSFLANSIIGLLINAWPNRKLLNYSFGEQLKDIIPNIVLSLVMYVCVILIGKLPWNMLLVLATQIISGAAVYIAGSVLTRNQSFLYIWNIIKSYIKK